MGTPGGLRTRAACEALSEPAKEVMGRAVDGAGGELAGAAVAPNPTSSPRAAHNSSRRPASTNGFVCSRDCGRGLKAAGLVRCRCRVLARSLSLALAGVGKQPMENSESVTEYSPTW